MAADNRSTFHLVPPEDNERGGQEQSGRSPQVEPEIEFRIAAELSDLEEKGDVGRKLRITAVVLVAIAVIVALFAYVLRPQPKAYGTMDEAFAVALPQNNVMATITVTLKNVSNKPLWIRNMRAELITADGNQYKDEAANAVDFERYFRGFPTLREHSAEPLRVETKLQPGQQARGSVIVSFPVALEAFNGRRSLSVVIEPYDQAAMTITK